MLFTGIVKNDASLAFQHSLVYNMVCETSSCVSWLLNKRINHVPLCSELLSAPEIGWVPGVTRPSSFLAFAVTTPCTAWAWAWCDVGSWPQNLDRRAWRRSATGGEKRCLQQETGGAVCDDQSYSENYRPQAVMNRIQLHSAIVPVSSGIDDEPLLKLQLQETTKRDW